jgi:hypothetical protein
MFCIVKNIACNNKGDVGMFTTTSSIIVLVLLASLQKKIEIGVQSSYQT